MIHLTDFQGGLCVRKPRASGDDPAWEMPWKVLAG